MRIYYSGLNNSKLFPDEEGNAKPIIDKFTLVPFAAIDDLDIGWNYVILWRDGRLCISGNSNLNRSNDSDNFPAPFEPPDGVEGFRQTIAGKDSITALSTTNEIWQYKIFEKKWKKIPNFIYVDDVDDESEMEYVVEIFQGGCTVALTNFGRVYNIPVLVEMPKRVKFTSVACGFDHTVMLAENGDVYSMGMGTRGQLGHGDLEDCDDPKIIEALAGIKVIQIAAGGWHTAVVTDQGDLYTWGWNTSGELGIINDDAKVFATPKPVDFTDNEGRSFDAIAKKVQCGNMFTICMLEDNSMWGCGSNKYGQLGMPTDTLQVSKKFLRLVSDVDDAKNVKDFKCREWATVLWTE